MTGIFSLGAIVALIALLLVAPPVAAQVLDLTLERLVARDDIFDPIGRVRIISRQCNPDGSGHLGFAASGVAIGPYPGRFREVGSLAWDSFGQVTSFSAAFTIVSATGRVTGVKGPPVLGRMVCNDATGEMRNVKAINVSYRARIKTALGTCADQGFAEVIIEDQRPTLPGQLRSRVFHESFVSDAQPLICGPAAEDAEDDEDDD